MVDDSDSPIISVDEFTLIKDKKEFEEVCRILSISSENYVEVDYKNEFYLKNGQSVKLVLKYLTYRIPWTDKNIEPHIIHLKLLRNTIPCA